MVWSVNYSKKEEENLETFQRKCLKQLQGFPKNASNSACQDLLDILPIESDLLIYTRVS